MSPFKTGPLNFCPSNESMHCSILLDFPRKNTDQRYELNSVITVLHQGTFASQYIYLSGGESFRNFGEQEDV